MNIYIFFVLVLSGTVYGKACDTGFWECNNGKCVYESWLCDGDDDCGDGSDEIRENCPACLDYQFTCAIGQCIRLEEVCNGYQECRDNSDEVDPVTGECPACPDYAFDCHTTGRCLRQAYVCDGDNDCLDWSDENEETCPCSEGELRCSKMPGVEAPGACIPPEWICDEIMDCPGGDDEQDCARPTSVHKNYDRKIRKTPPNTRRSKTPTKSVMRTWFNIRKR